MEKSEENIRVQQWVVVIAIALFAIKIAAYYLTQSVAILTDALESTVNVIAGVISLYSLYISGRPRDENHPYGHGKAEFLSAAVEGALVLMAGCIIVYEAIINFIHPHALRQLNYGIGLITITGIVNFVAGAICIRKGKKNRSIALVASGKHLQTDTYSTAGIILGLGIIYFTRQNRLDSVVSLIFAGIIIYTGYRILRSSIAGIMDEADKKLLERMVGFLNHHRRANWIDLHNLRVIKYGGLLHVDCHLTVPWYLNVHQAHQEIDALVSLIRTEFGEAMEFFVHSDGCLDFSCNICTKDDCSVRQHPFRERIEWEFDNVAPNRKHRMEMAMATRSENEMAKNNLRKNDLH
ncbi:MAG: cation diffusion facilitator family transporter [Puia sp.]|nr:cation diffusion facilitator family transporter [Puia sp.]